MSQLYAGLNSLYPTIGGAVSQAAAVGRDAGPSADTIAAFLPAWAVRTDLLRRAGYSDQAAQAYEKAISLCTEAPMRKWLEAQVRS